MFLLGLEIDLEVEIVDSKEDGTRVQQSLLDSGLKYRAGAVNQRLINIYPLK